MCCFSLYSSHKSLKQYYTTFILFLFVYVVQRWVWAYRKDRLLVNVNTNNGPERQNLGFKSEYLVGRCNSSLSTMLSILLEEFLPESYDRYVESNVRISSQYRQYNVEVPLYLHDRPPLLINHCLDRLSSAVEIEQECIRMTDEERGTLI